MSKRIGAAARARAASRASDSPREQLPVTFDSLVKEGIECHDTAEKRRNNNPTSALQLYREAIEKYERAEQMISGEEKSSADLAFNMGVAYAGLAALFKSMDTRNSAQQADENLLLACQCYGQVIKLDPQNAEAMNNWVCDILSRLLGNFLRSTYSFRGI
jgi:tetratricopeptide (TPR) repeat protein